MPRFPKKPDSMVNAEEMEKRREQFEDYLRNLMASEFFRNHPETVSCITIVLNSNADKEKVRCSLIVNVVIFSRSNGQA